MLNLLLTMLMVHSHCGYLQDQINMLIENASAFGITNQTIKRVTNEYVSEGCSIYNSTWDGFLNGWQAGTGDFNITRSACPASYDPDFCRGYNQGYLDSLTLSESDLSDHFYKQWLDQNKVVQSVSSP